MLLLDRTGEIDELWPKVEEGDLPEAGRVLIPLSRLDEVLGSNLEIGVEIPNDTDPASLAPHFGRLAMISVDFPSFADGRGFSIGRSLRQAGFVGRLRATGPVIADQFTYLLQCGFDEVSVPPSVAERQPIDQWLAQLGIVTIGYQRGRDQRGSILDQRRG